MRDLLAKKVLLIAPQFFGYEQAIIQELEVRGASVYFLPDRPFENPIFKALVKIKPEIFWPICTRLYRKVLLKFNVKHFDYIFIINGQTVSYSFLSELRNKNPGAKIILYAWDSIDNRPQILRNLALCDKTFSFDPECSDKYKMELRPLFYSRGFDVPSPKYKYQLSFIGTAHSDRYAIIARLQDKLSKEITTFYYLYLQTSWVFWLYKLTKSGMRSSRKDDFHFHPLSKEKVQAVFADSLAVVDIEHPNQRGLTMRTFETIGAGKKLITTNKSVVNYDFYSSGNICVIDRLSPQIPSTFLSTPASSYSSVILYRYSLAGWIDEIFELSKNLSTQVARPLIN